MSNVPVVKELPELNQDDFPPIPKIVTEHTLSPFGTAWGNAEKEAAAGAIVTVCANEGEWKPVDVRDLAKALERSHVYKLNPQAVINATWALIADGELKIVQLEGEGQYMIPTPALAAKVLAEGVRMMVVGD